MMADQETLLDIDETLQRAQLCQAQEQSFTATSDIMVATLLELAKNERQRRTYLALRESTRMRPEAVPPSRGEWDYHRVTIASQEERHRRNPYAATNTMYASDPKFSGEVFAVDLFPSQVVYQRREDAVAGVSQTLKSTLLMPVEQQLVVQLWQQEALARKRIVALQADWQHLLCRSKEER